LVQAYKVFVPDLVALGKVKLVGGEALHFVDLAEGAIADVVTM